MTERTKSAVQSPVPEPFQPVAAVLAMVLPGLGHAYLGERLRAAMIATSVLGMFFGGILIGGIDVVDRRDNFIWFLGEALVGPVAFGVDTLHQNRFKGIDPVSGKRRSANPNEVRVRSSVNPANNAPCAPTWFLVSAPAGDSRLPPNIKSLGRVNELGTLFCTIAGMMNLICALDAAFRARVERTGPMGVVGRL